MIVEARRPRPFAILLLTVTGERNETHLGDGIGYGALAAAAASLIGALIVNTFAITLALNSQPAAQSHSSSPSPKGGV